MPDSIPLDCLIFGGGAAGLWLLDDLTRAGYSTLLLEAHELGSGQTIASQGIIHGGLKYTLSGLLTPSARAISAMPLIWRRCLAGEAKPNLSNTRLRAEYCHLWRTASIKSRLAMIGARAGLKVKPVNLDLHERPPALADVPGAVARLDEQVIEPASFLHDLSHQHASRILKIDAARLRLSTPSSSAEHAPAEIQIAADNRTTSLSARLIIFTAGAGNAHLCQLAGVPHSPMQQRPLHMVLVRREDLPILNGHCVDGSATRLTITTARDFDDRVVWQVGGQLAEAGVSMPPLQLIEFAQSELDAVLPAIDLAGADWATYRVDRAEPATRGGTRPDDAYAGREGIIVTAWPTKMALVPELTRRITMIVHEILQGRNASEAAPSSMDAVSSPVFDAWPRPVVALPPWENPKQQWFPGR
ncbi:MAG: FAD-dependent oxidoreductase [Phycisphaerales bacterium]|nr:FAD-dependent oxidoreductase [Phycisphaerales bacterium]MCI0630297.1 FAD-dependent oxidoreductase [Phycisphaerales bacterium]